FVSGQSGDVLRPVGHDLIGTEDVLTAFLAGDRSKSRTGKVFLCPRERGGAEQQRWQQGRDGDGSGAHRFPLVSVDQPRIHPMGGTVKAAAGRRGGEKRKEPSAKASRTAPRSSLRGERTRGLGHSHAERIGLPTRKAGFAPARGRNFCTPPLSTSAT